MTLRLHPDDMGHKESWRAYLVLGTLVAALVAVSWQRWANPIVDCGREMYVPWRIEEGNVLCVDVYVRKP